MSPGPSLANIAENDVFQHVNWAILSQRNFAEVFLIHLYVL